MKENEAQKPFYGATLFTIPRLGWKIVDTPQGWSYEFADGSCDWPNPRERQIIEAYQDSHTALLEAAKHMLAALRQARDEKPDEWDALVTPEIASAWTETSALAEKDQS